MQRKIDGGSRQARRRPRRVHRIQVSRRLDGRVQRPPADLPLIRAGDREDREHGVADEFQHLSAPLTQRRRERLEYVVQQRHHDRARNGIADAGETSYVGVPDHGAQALDRAARDRARVDARAGVLTEIGSEKSRCDNMACMGLHCQRQRRQRRPQHREIILVEAASTIAHERIDDAAPLRAIAPMAFAVNEKIGDIVRPALLEKLLERFEVALVRARLEASPHPRIRLAVLRPVRQVAQGTREPDRILARGMGISLRSDRVSLSQPEATIAGPLRV